MICEKAATTNDVKTYVEYLRQGKYNQYPEDLAEVVKQNLILLSDELVENARKNCKGQLEVQSQAIYIEPKGFEMLKVYLKKYGFSLPEWANINYGSVTKDWSKHSLLKGNHDIYRGFLTEFWPVAFKYSFLADNPFVFPKKSFIKTLEFKYSSADHIKAEWKAAKNKEVKDLTLKAGETEYCVHKIKLIVHSEYFKRMLDPKLGSCPENGVILIPEEESIPMKRLLKFMYVGELSNKQLGNFEQTFAILKLATRFEVKKLIERCGVRIQEQLVNITLERATLVKLLEFAMTYNSEELIKICFCQIEIHSVFISMISDVVTPKNFKMLHEIAETSKFLNILKELGMCIKYNPALRQGAPVESKGK